MWSGKAKGGNRTHDQARIDLAKRIVIDPHLGHQRRRIVMNDDVGPRNKSAKLLPRIRLSQVKRHASLIGIQREKKTTFFRMTNSGRKWTTFARLIPVWLFYLDDISAEIRNELGRIGCRHQVSQFKNMYTFESSHRLCLLSLSTATRAGYQG